jgi:hypothetical protein
LTGTVAFIRSVSIEAVGLGVHLAAGAHDILMKTEHALTTVPPPLASCEAKRTKHNIRANQPESAQQGMKQVLSSSALHNNLYLFLSKKNCISDICCSSCLGLLLNFLHHLELYL